MDGLKRRWDELRGLKLFLLFVFGPLKTGVCGDCSFTKEVQKYLEGNYSNITELKKEIPKQFEMAWPYLLKISKNNKQSPLSLETVSDYVFKYHNILALPSCKVMNGKVQKINRKRKIFTVQTETESLKINFLDPYSKNIKIDDTIAFHHGWFIAKTNELHK